ncbi:hypothetical protein vseg_001716 [Gypsophila vaccaria]
MYAAKGPNKNSIIRNPPSIYPWIIQSEVDKFIATYTDPKFKKLSKLNRERTKKKNSSYRGGRKGYFYYEEEIAKELQTQDIEVIDVPRYLVWIRAHSRQENGVMYFDNPADLEVAQAIKALEAQQIQGEVDAKGQNDILRRALKSPEHGGSVKGVGSGVIDKQYFGYNKPTPPCQLQAEFRKVKSKLENVINTHNLLLSYLASSQSNLEQLKQFGLTHQGACGDQGQLDFASSQMFRFGGTKIASTKNIADQGIQGIDFQLSQRLVGTQEGDLDGTKGLSNHG